MIEHLYAQLINASAKKAQAVFKIARANGLDGKLAAMIRMGGRCG